MDLDSQRNFFSITNHTDMGAINVYIKIRNVQLLKRRLYDTTPDYYKLAERVRIFLSFT